MKAMLGACGVLALGLAVLSPWEPGATVGPDDRVPANGQAPVDDDDQEGREGDDRDDDDDEGEVERAIAVSEVPVLVLRAAEAALPGAAFTDAEEETGASGVSYSLAGTLDGQPIEIEISADGTVLEIERN